jgi:hypothetical protein
MGKMDNLKMKIKKVGLLLLSLFVRPTVDYLVVIVGRQTDRTVKGYYGDMHGELSANKAGAIIAKVRKKSDCLLCLRDQPF